MCQKNAVCLKTFTGLFINYYGICFFASDTLEYLPWKKTLLNGILPPVAEYGRIRKIGIEERRLTDDEQIKAATIAQNLQRNPLWSLSLEQLAYVINYQRAKADLPSIVFKKKSLA